MLRFRTNCAESGDYCTGIVGLCKDVPELRARFGDRLFCVVHGLTQNATGSSPLVRELEKRAHQTLCITLPNDPDASGVQDATVIANALADSKESPIVVAHSASGLFLPLFVVFHRGMACGGDILVARWRGHAGRCYPIRSDRDPANQQTVVEPLAR